MTSCASASTSRRGGSWRRRSASTSSAPARCAARTSAADVRASANANATSARVAIATSNASATANVRSSNNSSNPADRARHSRVSSSNRSSVLLNRRVKPLPLPANCSRRRVVDADAAAVAERAVGAAEPRKEPRRSSHSNSNNALPVRKARPGPIAARVRNAPGGPVDRVPSAHPGPIAPIVPRNPPTRSPVPRQRKATARQRSASASGAAGAVEGAVVVVRVAARRRANRTDRTYYASGVTTGCAGTTNAGAGNTRGPRFSRRCRAEHSANPSQRMQ